MKNIRFCFLSIFVCFATFYLTIFINCSLLVRIFFLLAIWFFFVVEANDIFSGHTLRVYLLFVLSKRLKKQIVRCWILTTLVYGICDCFVFCSFFGQPSLFFPISISFLANFHSIKHWRVLTLRYTELFEKYKQFSQMRDCCCICSYSFSLHSRQTWMVFFCVVSIHRPSFCILWRLLLTSSS